MAQQVFGDVFKKGEAILQSVSGRLLEKPAVAKAFEAAMVGKSRVDEGVAKAMKSMNVQSRSEFRGLKARVDALTMQVAELQEAIAALRANVPSPAPLKKSASVSRGRGVAKKKTPVKA